MDLDPTAYLRLLGAFVLALPTAWNRERSGHIMGLRSFPLFATGCCAYVLIGQSFIGPDSPDAMARIIQGLLSGIGFVGGGAILKNGDHVQGTAVAVSIWLTGAMGVAVAFGNWDFAILLSAINFLTVEFLSRLKKRVPTDDTRK